VLLMTELLRDLFLCAPVFALLVIAADACASPRSWASVLPRSLSGTLLLLLHVIGHL